jgi:hypothetical protein
MTYYRLAVDWPAVRAAIFPVSALPLNRGHAFSSNDAQSPQYLQGDSFGRDNSELILPASSVKCGGGPQCSPPHIRVVKQCYGAQNGEWGATSGARRTFLGEDSRQYLDYEKIIGQVYQEMFLILFGAGGFEGNRYRLSQCSKRYDSMAGSRGFRCLNCLLLLPPLLSRRLWDDSP